MSTGVELSKILGGQTKILRAESGKKWYVHGRFSIIGGHVPGLPPRNLRQCLCHHSNPNIVELTLFQH